MESKDKLAALGFPYANSVIQMFEGGSKMHGAKLEGTDDTDWYGVFIEPPAKILGVDSYEHFVWTTGGERGGNKPSDIDVTLYSLQKWARLACKGNPSVLHFLFAKDLWGLPYWHRIKENRTMFLARAHMGQFMGYANAQLQRLFNQRGQKNCNRPFLEEQHGYDTKYAMHIIRLLHEAREFLSTANITLPRPEKELLIQIRKGDFKLHEILAMANSLQEAVLGAKEASPLPDKVDRRAVSELISDIYLKFYAENL